MSPHPTKVRIVKIIVFPVAIYGLPCGSDSKASAYNAGDLGSIPGLGISPGEGTGDISSILAWKILSDGLVGSPCSPRDSQESSPTPQFKSINSSVLSFLHSSTHIHT